MHLRAPSSLVGPPWVISVSVAIVFFLAARLSLALLDKTDGIAVFWPAAGVATGFLVAFGSTVRWPVVTGVVAATLAANLLGDRNLASSTFFAVANVVRPPHCRGADPAIPAARHSNSMSCVVSVGLFGATIAAALSAASWARWDLCSFIPQPRPPSTIWRHWVATETLGTITVAPLVIGLASFWRNRSATARNCGGGFRARGRGHGLFAPGHSAE